ncbi:MAG TPA: hypothetical protein VGT08_00130 [Terracidiphilus sp.]|nr:hypothetical protein [Terracidiphilus sp.]
MRLLLVVVMALAGALATLSAQPQQPETAGQLVREVVYNELQDPPGTWFLALLGSGTKRTRRSARTKWRPRKDPLPGFTSAMGVHGDRSFKKQEEARLQQLLGSTWEQDRNRRDYSDEEERIGRILVILPDAFLYEYDGEEKSCRRLSFRPNPPFVAKSVEARIFHALSGTLCVDTQYKRLVQIDGRLQENVDFGFGILGWLSKGGWFQLKRTQVSAIEWQIEGLEVHFSGRVILFRDISRETSEVRGGSSKFPRA